MSPRPRKSPAIQGLPGALDVLPDDQKYWRYVVKKLAALAEDYGFERIDTSILEPTLIFQRAALGQEEGSEKTWITARVLDSVETSLRPSLAPSLLRAYLQYGLGNRPHPIKLFSTGSVFSNQNNVCKQKSELAVATVGDDSEVVDAEMLFLGHKMLEMLGLHGYVVHINTLGDINCRPAYLRALKDFFKLRVKKVCAKCKNNLKANPMLLLACQEETCREVLAEVPQAVDFLDEACRVHFKRILEFLDSAKISYFLNPLLIKSGDAYTRTLFEFHPEEGMSENPIIAGGRADRLLDLLGGTRSPLITMALNLSQIVGLIKSRNQQLPDVGIKPKVFLVQLGDAAKRKSLLLFEDIRRSGIEIRYSLSRDSIKSQLRMAAKHDVKFTLIFGQKEAIEGTVILREMETGIQETIPLEKIIDELKRRLKK